VKDRNADKQKARGRRIGLGRISGTSKASRISQTGGTVTKGNRGRAGTTPWLLLTFAVLLSMTACGTPGTEARQVVEKSGQKVTVMENTTASVYTKLKLASIDKFEGIRGMDWLDENKLAVDKENRKLTPEIIEGQERYPHNFYIRDLVSGQEQPLKEGKESLGYAIASPDNKYIFYKEVFEATGIGYIMNLDTREAVQLGKDGFMATEGEWADSGHVIYPDMKGDILKADVQGGTERVLATGAGFIHNVVQSGSIIYYIAHEDSELIAYDTDTKKSGVIKKNVMWAIPSPDGSQLAIVKREGPGDVKLLICDPAGNEQSVIDTGMQIFGTSWSPDGSKLAYNVSSDNGSVNRLFITEVETGEQTPISDDMQASDKLRWSPSGKKLLASTSVLKDNKYQFTTYVITLS
jgi:TolB protein